MLVGYKCTYTYNNLKQKSCIYYTYLSLMEVAVPVSKFIVLPASGFLEILHLYMMSLLCKGKYWYDFMAT